MKKYILSINFEDVSSLDNINHLVFTGLALEQNDTDTIQQIEDFFNEQRLFEHGNRSILGMRRILGNVLGDKGRHDWVIDFEECPGNNINPLVRLKLSNMGIKWVDDFVDNYKQDYTD